VVGAAGVPGRVQGYLSHKKTPFARQRWKVAAVSVRTVLASNVGHDYVSWTRPTVLDTINSNQPFPLARQRWKLAAGSVSTSTPDVSPSISRF